MVLSSTFNGVTNNTHPTWWKDTSIRWNCLWILTCALGSTYSGYDSSLLTGLQALPKFEEYFPRLRDANTLGLTTAAQFFPGLVFPILASWMADRYDRKTVMIIGVVGICIGAVIQCTARSLTQFILSRVIIGTTGSMSQFINPTMLVEIAHPRIRSVASASCLTFFFIGSIIAAWTSFGTLTHFPESDWCWRLPCLLQGLIPLLILPLCILIPHSPRWLVAKGRVEDAQLVLATQHANGELQDPLVLLELEEIQRAIELERVGKSTTYSSFFHTKGNRKRLFIVVTIALGSQWAGNGIAAYYLVPVLRSVDITSPTSQTLVGGGATILGWFFALGGAFLVERAGRRPIWLTSTGVMAVSLILATVFASIFVKNPSHTLGGAVIAFFYLTQGGYSIGWTPLNFAYNVEILPYNLRSKGMAIWGIVSAAAAVAAIWVNAIALAAIGWKFYIVYVIIDTYLFTIIWLVFPETKSLSLEEVALRFDGAIAEQIIPQVHPNIPQLEDMRIEDYKEDETNGDDYKGSVV